MNNASEKIQYEVRYELCKNKCNMYGKCLEPCNNDCGTLLALAQQYNGNIKEQINVLEMSAKELYQLCCKQMIKCDTKQNREYYINLLYSNGYVDDKLWQEAICSESLHDGEDVVNEPSHYQHGSFEVIDEMIIVFGIEKTITFCQLNAWKYRARAPYKGKFEEDMAKANRYLEMAYELQQICQGYPDASGDRVCELLKG